MVYASDDAKGFLLYGPYVPLRAGEYVAQFEVAGEASTSGPVLRLEVYLPAVGVIASREIAAEELSVQGAGFSLVFTLAREDVCELRAVALGAAKLRVGQDVALLSDQARLNWSEGEGAGSLERLPFAYSGFLVRNWKYFETLVGYGFPVQSRGREAQVTAGDLKLPVRNLEDYQVFFEIFLHNDYRVFASKPLRVIDIGMNSGFASLFFASQPEVRAVHAFEPFRPPFERALENIKLNGAIGEKIRASHFGIGGKDEDIEVYYNQDYTISGSVRGYQAGEKVRLTLRDAKMLEEITSEARRNGEKILLKMDCEGSEFAIVDRLHACGLLSQIDIVVMEWHKWWSKDLTQADLVSKLTAGGHIVFDRTCMDNNSTGMLFSARAL